MVTSTTPITKIAFVTVGSTRFNALIQNALQQETLSALRVTGFTRLVVQCGESTLLPPWDVKTLHSDNIDGLEVEIWKYKPSLSASILEADLVISHAGT